ncbi:MAG: hypothetical protein RL726_993 [Actinomycetota bacterium]|jgi:predicted nucleotidyltransferase
MKVNHPFMSITGGLEGGVLEVLAGTTGTLSLTEIHRRFAAASKSGIRKSLMRLVAGGIVDAVPGGYRLNREHVAAGAIESLASLRGQLFERISAEVATWTSKVALVGVFGSVARGEGDEHSDIDVLVVADDLPEFVTGDLAAKVRRWTGNECHVLTLTRREMEDAKSANEPIVQSWKVDLVVLGGDRAIVD